MGEAYVGGENFLCLVVWVTVVGILSWPTHIKHKVWERNKLFYIKPLNSSVLPSFTYSDGCNYFTRYLPHLTIFSNKKSFTVMLKLLSVQMFNLGVGEGQDFFENLIKQWAPFPPKRTHGILHAIAGVRVFQSTNAFSSLRNGSCTSQGQDPDHSSGVLMTRSRASLQLLEPWQS